MKLVQRRGLGYQTYELTDDGVRIRIDSLNQGGTCVIPYTSIPHTPNEVTSSSTVLMAMALIPLGLCCICGLFWLTQPNISFFSFEGYALLSGLLTGLFFLTIFLTHRKAVLVYTDGNSRFALKASSPSQEAVTRFVAGMGEAKLGHYEKCIKRIRDADSAFNVKSAVVSLIDGGYITEDQAGRLSQSLEIEDGDAPAFGFVSQTPARSA